MVKNPPANAGDTRNAGLNPGLGRSPRGRNGNPLTPVFLPGKFHGQRSLASYSPWGHQELDMTEHTQTLKPNPQDWQNLPSLDGNQKKRKIPK